MKLCEITWSSGNDFEAVLECEHCGEFQSMERGYHDSRFLHHVIPRIACLSCLKRTDDSSMVGISDPGFQYGKRLQRKLITVTRAEWVPVSN